MATRTEQSEELPAIAIANRLKPGDEIELTAEGMVIRCPGHADLEGTATVRANPDDKFGPPVIECSEPGCTQAKRIVGLKRLKLWRWGEKTRARRDGLVSSWLPRDYGQASTPWLYYRWKGGAHGYWETTGRVMRQVLSTQDGVTVRLEDVQQRGGPEGWSNTNFKYDWPIYNIKEVMAKAAEHKVVFCVDDEAECDLLDSWNLTAFCHRGGTKNPKGFAKAQPELALKGVKSVAIIPALDKGSMALARKKARRLNQHGIETRLVCLPCGPESKDWVESNGPGVIQWAENYGGNKETLLKLAAGTPVFEPDDSDQEEEEVTEIIKPGSVLGPSKYWQELVKRRPSADPFKHLLTETGNAFFFVYYYGDVVRFLGGKENTFLVWDGTRWVRDNEFPTTLFQEMIAQMRADILAVGSIDADRVLKWCAESEAGGRVAASVRLARGWLKISPDELDQLKWVLPCKNGIIDLRTGEKKDHDPSLFYTRRINLEYRGLEYAETGCPTFWMFLRSAFQNDLAFINSVLECHAVCLTGDSRFRKWFLNYGKKGREGKSTVCEAVLKILVPEVYSRAVSKDMLCITSQQNKFNDPGNCHHMRMLLMDEIGKSDKIDPVKSKSLTGNDSIAGSRVYENTKTVPSTHYFYGFANDTPKFDAGADRAAQERLVLILWPVHIEKEQENPLIKQTILDEELEGVLSVLVQMCVQIHGRGKLDIHPKMELDKEEYLAGEDIFGQMLKEVFQRGEGELTCDQMHSEHVLWFKDADLRPLSKPSFGKELHRRGFENRQNVQGCSVYYDVQIRPEWANRPRKSRYTSSEEY